MCQFLPGNYFFLESALAIRMAQSPIFYPQISPFTNFIPLQIFHVWYHCLNHNLTKLTLVLGTLILSQFKDSETF